MCQSCESKFTFKRLLVIELPEPDRPSVLITVNKIREGENKKDQTGQKSEFAMRTGKNGGEEEDST